MEIKFKMNFTINEAIIFYKTCNVYKKKQLGLSDVIH